MIIQMYTVPGGGVSTLNGVVEVNIVTFLLEGTILLEYMLTDVAGVEDTVDATTAQESNNYNTLSETLNTTVGTEYLPSHSIPTTSLHGPVVKLASSTATAK